jgi:hypothetical protein
MLGFESRILRKGRSRCKIYFGMLLPRSAIQSPWNHLNPRSGYAASENGVAEPSQNIGRLPGDIRSIGLELIMENLPKGIVITPVEGKSDSRLLAKCPGYVFEQFLAWMEYVPATATGSPPVLDMLVNFDA